MKLRIGTRGSNLALTQTNWVAKELQKIDSHLEIEIVKIKTKGDLILDKALDKIGDKGLFVKEIESALLDHKIDCAIHSLKDMPSEAVEGLSFSKTPIREDRRDVLILAEGYKTLEDVHMNSTLGTGSKRRCFQLNKLRPDLKFVPVRGNIETRIGKIKSENLAGVVLAAAGIHRLGLHHTISQYLEEEDFIPAPAQGALGIQYRSEDLVIKVLLDAIGSELAENEILAERSFMKHVNGGCHAPVGAYSIIKDKELTLTGLFGTDNGDFLSQHTVKGLVKDGQALGKKLAGILLKEIENYEG